MKKKRKKTMKVLNVPTPFAWEDWSCTATLKPRSFTGAEFSLPAKRAHCGFRSITMNYVVLVAVAQRLQDLSHVMAGKREVTLDCATKGDASVEKWTGLVSWTCWENTPGFIATRCVLQFRLVWRHTWTSYKQSNSNDSRIFLFLDRSRHSEHL